MSEGHKNEQVCISNGMWQHARLVSLAVSPAAGAAKVKPPAPAVLVLEVVATAPPNLTGASVPEELFVVPANWTFLFDDSVAAPASAGAANVNPDVAAGFAVSSAAVAVAVTGVEAVPPPKENPEAIGALPVSFS
jgi:hypothetical protein